MKTIPMIAVAAWALAAISCSSTKSARYETAESQPVALTGSYIKQDVHKTGVITDGSNPVYVLDQNEIQNSGAGDLSEVLIRKGFRR
jgi:hypothetical protein